MQGVICVCVCVRARRGLHACLAQQLASHALQRAPLAACPTPPAPPPPPRCCIRFVMEPVILPMVLEMVYF